MKNKYQAPKASTISFDSFDVICYSNETSGTGDKITFGGIEQGLSID